MKQPIKSNLQILFVLLFATIFLILLSIVVGATTKASPAAAQGPEVTPSPMLLSAEGRKLFSRYAGQVQAAATYQLNVTKGASPSQVTVGQVVTFVVTISNLTAGTPAQLIAFQDSMPTGMQNTKFDFGSTAVVSDSTASPPIYLFTAPIINGKPVIITVTAVMTTNDRYGSVTNVASVAPLSALWNNDQTQVKTAYALVSVYNPVGYQKIYLPEVRRDPTPTPPPNILAYYEDFSSSSNSWNTFSSNGCTTERTSSNGGQYVIRLDSNKTCLPPARDVSKPERPYRTYGEFEVALYHSEGASNIPVGIFINGSGADNYYLFRIWANTSCSNGGGDWELVRRRNGNESTILGKTTCDTRIKRGYTQGDKNTIRIKHTSDRVLTLYANGYTLGSVTDSSANHLTGTATGVYVKTEGTNVVVKIDDFWVYKFP